MNEPIPEPAIQFRQVSYRFDGGTELLDNLDLDVRSGETLILLGKSGSGKTTTLKLINHLLVPTSGEIRVQGRSTRQWDPIRLRRSIGYAIQDVGLFPHFTVERNIGLSGRAAESRQRTTVGHGPTDRNELKGFDCGVELPAEGLRSGARWLRIQVRQRDQVEPAANPGAREISERS